MAVTITGGDVQHPGTFQAVETLTQSTATAPQNISTSHGVTILGMGTATGLSRNLYDLLASTAVEGAQKMIAANATGEANVFIAAPTIGRLPFHISLVNNPTATAAIDQVWASATGRWMFQTEGDYIFLKFMSGAWHFLDANGATQIAAT